MSRQQLYSSFIVIFMALVIKKYYDLQRNYDELLNLCNIKSEDEKTSGSHNDKTDQSEAEVSLKRQTGNTSRKSKEVHQLQDSGTSVVCQRGNTDQNICHFKNLCYSTLSGEFVIFLSNSSISVDAGDLNEFEFSSVEKHNFHFHSFIEAPVAAALNFNITIMESRTLIFNRFKPDNIMHVFHDDIIPLHTTLKIIDFSNNGIYSPYDIQLLFMEDSFDEVSEFDFVYEMFSTLAPLKKADLENMADMLCFKDAYIGLTKSTLWYQYGFFTPQGPLPDVDTKTINIRATIEYILHASRKDFSYSNKEYIVLLSRKENRKIINEKDLVMSLARVTRLKVLILSFETHTLSEMIPIVSNAQGIIGMHGSLLILALFLRPGGIIVELFPYAVNPSHYTPFKTLAGVKNMNLVYKSWRNQIKENSLPHPDFSPEMGGIGHLSPEEQTNLKSQEDVPQHLCCNDPSWLYHIYQDTIVDCDAVSQLTLESLNQPKTFSSQESATSFTVSPGRVKDISCEHALDVNGLGTLTISWSRPGNVVYLNYSKLTYEVLLQAEQDEEDTKLYIVSLTRCSIPNVQPAERYFIWVRCVIDERRGSYSKATKC